MLRWLPLALLCGCSVVVDPDFTVGCPEGCPCEAVCEGGCECPRDCSCSLGCSDGSCAPRCEAGSVCAVVGEGTDSLDATCGNGAFCHMICRDAANCRLDCRQGTCLVECEGSGMCELRNCAAPMLCADPGVAVCGRACP